MGLGFRVWRCIGLRDYQLGFGGLLSTISRSLKWRDMEDSRDRG